MSFKANPWVVFAGLALLFAGCNRVPSPDSLLSFDTQLKDKSLAKLAKLKEEKRAILVGPMIQNLHDPDPQVSQRALDALVVIGPPAIPSLIPILTEQDPYLRAAVANALGRMGVSNSPSVEALSQSLSDPHPLVRDEAGFALKKIGSPEALAALDKAPKKKSKA